MKMQKHAAPLCLLVGFLLYSNKLSLKSLANGKHFFGLKQQQWWKKLISSLMLRKNKLERFPWQAFPALFYTSRKAWLPSGASSWLYQPLFDQAGKARKGQNTPWHSKLQHNKTRHLVKWHSITTVASSVVMLIVVMLSVVAPGKSTHSAFLRRENVL